MTSKTAIAALAATLAMCLPTSATSILPNYDFGDSHVGIIPITGEGIFDYRAPNGASANGTVSVALYPDPRIELSGSGGNGEHFDGEAKFNYFLQILNPSPPFDPGPVSVSLGSKPQDTQTTVSWATGELSPGPNSRSPKSAPAT